MGTVTSISKNRVRRATRISLGDMAKELRNDLTKPEVRNAQPKDCNTLLIEEVEALASEHCVKRLELAQRRERFEREMKAEEAELDAELEHAAYHAFMLGVPEESIYELDERTADALSNAIKKAQATA